MPVCTALRPRPRSVGRGRGVAFPKAPSSVFEEEGGPKTQWLSVVTTNGLREALQLMLQTSDVLVASLASGFSAEDITVDAASSAPEVSRLFRLGLYAPDGAVPSTCRQMFETVTAAYRAIAFVDYPTREELHGMLRPWGVCHQRWWKAGGGATTPRIRRYMVIPMGYKLPGLSMAMENEEALLRFCSELTVKWLQPYFARPPPPGHSGEGLGARHLRRCPQDANFYVPPDSAACKTLLRAST